MTCDTTLLAKSDAAKIALVHISGIESHKKLLVIQYPNTICILYIHINILTAIMYSSCFRSKFTLKITPSEYDAATGTLLIIYIHMYIFTKKNIFHKTAQGSRTYAQRRAPDDG